MSTFYIGSELKLFSYLTLQNKALSDVSTGTVFYHEETGLQNSPNKGSLYVCIPSASGDSKRNVPLIHTLVSGTPAAISVSQASTNPGTWTINYIGGDGSGNSTIKGYDSSIQFNSLEVHNGICYTNIGTDLIDTGAVYIVRAFKNNGDEVQVTSTIFGENPNYLKLDFGRDYTDETIYIRIFIEMNPIKPTTQFNKPDARE